VSQYGIKNSTITSEGVPRTSTKIWTTKNYPLHGKCLLNSVGFVMHQDSEAKLSLHNYSNHTKIGRLAPGYGYQ
jgi:hypothetical protein